jgi:PAS domain-containing protein
MIPSPFYTSLLRLNLISSPWRLRKPFEIGLGLPNAGLKYLIGHSEKWIRTGKSIQGEFIMKKDEPVNRTNEIELNPAKAAKNKALRRYRLNVIQIPRFRLLGFILVLFVAFLNNFLILQSFFWPRFLLLSEILMGYALFSWLILALFFSRVKKFDLGVLFLSLDILAFTIGHLFHGREQKLALFLPARSGRRPGEHLLSEGPLLHPFFGTLLPAIASLFGLCGPCIRCLVHRTLQGPHALYRQPLYLPHRQDGRGFAKQDGCRRRHGQKGDPETTKTEDDLKESEQRLKTLYDSVQAGVLLIDAETHTIVDVNPVAADLIGLPNEKIIGSVCHAFVCPAKKESVPSATWANIWTIRNGS